MKREIELQQFRELYKRGWAFIDIARICLPNVPLYVLRKWKHQYFHTRNNYTNQKKHFKNSYPLVNKSLSQFASEYAVTRQTLTKWKNELFPEITTKEHLFIKLIEKQDLTVNELSKLLGMTKISVMRFMQDYKAYKMQGVATTATIKRKAKKEKHNQLEIVVYGK